jgi:hypothetical protein
LVEAKDVTVNVLTSAVTTLVIIFLLIPLLKIPVPAVKETETIKEQKYYYPYTLPIEGDYSTWTIYDTFQDNDASNGGLRQEAIINKEETKIVLLDIFAYMIKTYTIATKTLSSGLMSDMNYFDGDSYLINEKKVSVQQTYIVTMGVTTFFPNFSKIYIVKDGALTQTLTDSDLGIAANSIRNVAISPSGKYIVVSGYISALSAMGWVVLIGK